MKLRHLLPILNTVTLAVVAGVFVQSHGGVKGDYTYLGSVTDAPTEPGDYGRVFFNRWQFYGDRETALTKSFLFANIPGFGAAKAALWILRNTFEEFRTSYPFGLSYASYSLLLGFPFSLLQWFGIGSLLDWLRRRSALGLRALTLMMIWLSASTAAATTVTPVGRRAECSYDGRPCGETMTYLGAPTATFRVFRTGPLQFTGKERDAETGLDYFGARYMSAAQGRFTSPDAPFADQHTIDPQSWNLYAYVRNNPLKNTDPNGRDCFQGVVSCANYVLGGVGAVTNAFSSGIINLPNRLADGLVAPFNGGQRVFGDLVPDAFTATNTDQRQGMEAANAVMLVSPLVELGAARAVSATAATLSKSAPAVAEASSLTAAEIQAGLKNAPLKTGQEAISAPAVNRYMDKIRGGQTAPPIKVDGNVIVDGNHRYAAGVLTGKPPATTPGTASPSQVRNARPFGQMKVDPKDWGNH